MDFLEKCNNAQIIVHQYSYSNLHENNLEKLSFKCY